jgi:hypothetical protein
MTEQELIHKLATKWHLSVPERRLLPHGKLKASLIFQVIERFSLIQAGILKAGGRKKASVAASSKN